jgi:hypothetical protein
MELILHVMCLLQPILGIEIARAISLKTSLLYVTLTFYFYIFYQGSAHDQRVLSDALYQHELKILPEKYYLGDAGYSNSDYCMVPYRGVRYHLKEQRQASQK